MLTRIYSGALSLALLAALPGAARAHEAIDEARRLYEEAEFGAAAAALARAEGGSDLSREELMVALELRLLLDVAAGEPERLVGDLGRLLTLAPDYRPGDEMPPEVHQAMEAVTPSGPIAVHAEATEGAGEVRVEARVENDPAELTRELRLTTRVGDGPPSTHPSPARVALDPEAILSYWAEAVGPGGVIVARDGSADAPRVFQIALEPRTTASGGGGDDALPWIVTGAVAGVLVVAGAIILGVVLASEGNQSDATQPTLPMVVGR